MANKPERITFQASEGLRAAIEAIAEDKGLSMSSYIVSVLQPILIKEGYLQAKKPANRVGDRQT